MLIGTALDVQVDDLLPTPMAASDKLILVFQRWIDSNKGVTWRKVLQICEDYPDKFVKAKADLESFLSFDRAYHKYDLHLKDDTSAKAEEFDKEKNWLEESEVKLKVTDTMHDAGADSSQHLLNEPPPEKATDSTQEIESTVATATETDEIDTESTVATATVTNEIDTESTVAVAGVIDTENAPNYLFTKLIS
uniref:Death domain-containing protein n=1 Tax=Amphimedon queenslandica TaxID=400682 RepID=A0A1X7SQC0_AMPQE